MDEIILLLHADDPFEDDKEVRGIELYLLVAAEPLELDDLGNSQKVNLAQLELLPLLLEKLMVFDCVIDLLDKVERSLLGVCF